VITRTPVPATGLPALPVVQVPLYPDPTRWYNVLGDTIALWNVPPDVTQVATGLAHNESDINLVTEKTLSNGQDFGTLKDGIWYIAVRFKNNIGWGSPAYYKISVDTAVPLPFATQIENAGTDNPSPMIQFETSDSLSGIAGYTVAVDGTVIATTTANVTTMTLPPQAPGTHTLVVSASDLAGNSALDGISFQILPLPTPQITFVGTSVSEGNFVFASGIGTPSSSVEVVVIDASKREVFDGMTPVLGDGHWDITVNVPLAAGRYSLSATAHNDQGAESVASAFDAFTVSAPSVISFGIIQLGWFEILIIVLLLIVAAVSLWSRRYVLKNQRRGLYNTVAARDIEKLSDILSANIKSMIELPSVKNAMSDPELVYHLGKLDENVARIKKYIKQELEQLK
jgi:hypothetical protein